MDRQMQKPPPPERQMLEPVLELHYFREARAAPRAGEATDTHSCGTITTVPEELRSADAMFPDGLGDFYQKYTEVYGIPVLGSSDLSDSALQRACYVARFLLADRYDLRNSYYQMYGRFALMGVNEVTLDIPEHSQLDPFWNDRARGIGGTPSRPVSTAGEENALCMTWDEGDGYWQEDIALHEFAHGVHLLAAVKDAVWDGFQDRLDAAYANAKANKLWEGTYAMETDREYFAEGVQSYFNANTENDAYHNDKTNCNAFKDYDPELFALVQETFPCGNTFIDRCDKDRDAELNQELKLNCVDDPVANACDHVPASASTCVDDDDSGTCPAWAGAGYCDSYADYMSLYCKASCGLCADPSCVDGEQYCEYWASIGQCEDNPNYMSMSCKKSCGLC